jgi:hypothetical protein
LRFGLLWPLAKKEAAAFQFSVEPKSNSISGEIPSENSVTASEIVANWDILNFELIPNVLMLPMKMNKTLIALCFLTGTVSQSTAEDQAGLDFFEKNVRPLLVKHCYACHSEKSGKRKGGLLLDRKSGWVKGGESGAAIIPKMPASSLFIEAINYESLEMPPKTKLKPHEIAVFEKWVKMGAPDPRDGSAANATRKIDFDKARQSWAFSKPRPADLLKVSDPAWTSDIDRLVRSTLAKHKIKPVGQASRLAWLRRVTFDITGLPPTAEEIRLFEDDSSPNVREKIVDRLLASEQFGVHWARHWMDVARYADSNGGDINLTYFNAWRYRDYLVNTFNSDKPYAEFIREQIAGDLMPASDDHDKAQKLIATGFLIIGPKMLSERNKEKLHMDVVDEQLDTIGRVFMGLTLGCARCHDHKFDPIPTKDYYALAGILRSTETVYGIRMGNVNVSGWLEQELPISAELVAKIAEHDKRTKAVSAELASVKKQLGTSKSNPTPQAKDLEGIVVDNTQAKLVGNWKLSKLTKHYVGAGYIHDEKKDLGKKSVTFVPTIPKAGEYEVRISYAYTKGRATNVPVLIKSADGEHTQIVNQEKPPEHNSLFKTLGRFKFEQGTSGFVRISNTGTNSFVIADAAQFLFVDDSKSPLKDKPDPDAAVKVAALKKQQTQLEAELKKLKATALKKPMAMSVRDFAKVSDTAIRIRGVVSQHGEVAPRGFLQVFDLQDSNSINGKQSGRLELAEWVSNPDNPLPARVIVNRIWAKLMGRGIVASVDNFGKLGDAPSHPQLLDHLAVDFAKNNSSIKHTIKSICLSKTYGLSSQFDADAFQADPENKWRWRQLRRRLPAESIRDAMLAVSGSLDLKLGGSSVTTLGESAVANNAGEAKGSLKGELPRRSLYLPIIRNDLPSFLTVFDFADPDVVTGERNVTNVPAQALLMLNSPFVLTNAQQTTAQMLKHSNDPTARVTWLYERLLGRRPTPAESKRAIEFVGANEKSWTTFCHSLLASSEFRMLE